MNKWLLFSNYGAPEIREIAKETPKKYRLVKVVGKWREWVDKDDRSVLGVFASEADAKDAILNARLLYDADISTLNDKIGALQADRSELMKAKRDFFRAKAEESNR